MRRESVKDAWLVSFISLLFSSLFSYFFGCFVVLRFEVINFGLENLKQSSRSFLKINSRNISENSQRKCQF